MVAVKAREVGRLARLVRQRARLTQAELARRAGVGRWKVIALEAGRLGELSFSVVEACLGELDMGLVVRAVYRGAEADRLRDQRHAELVEAITRLLRAFGWEVRVEVSFAFYGERGSIDVVAWHAPSRTLLVVEVKSELGSVEGTLRPLDVKCRLAPKVVRERFGWEAVNVARMVVFPEDRTVRRQVERHRETLRATLPAGSRDLRKWLRQPAGEVAGIWFLSDVGSVDLKRNPSSIRRIRRPGSRTEQAA
jgi:transcriptional regulator with XRE-family HTH domain